MLPQTGKLGQAQVIATAQGEKEFAIHDRIRFGRNEKTLGVKNGSLGTVERIEGGVLQVRLDGPGDTRVAVDTKFYKYLYHGYAATVHKAQGTTVDRTYVLATPHFDRHTTYVAMSRHRESATVFYAAEDFGGRDGRLTADQVQARFVDRLSRVQAKDLAHDYLETVPAVPDADATPAAKPTLEEVRRAGREQWRQERELAKQSGQAPSLEEIRRQGREDWLGMCAEQAAALSPAPAIGADLGYGLGSPDESERLKRLTAQELRQEIHQLRPEPVDRVVERDPAVQAAARASREQSDRLHQTQRRYAQAQDEAAQWRQAHPLKAQLHDRGAVRSGYLTERATAEVEAQAERLTALAQHATAQQQLGAARAVAAARITLETAPLRARIAQLERVLSEKVRCEQTMRAFKELAEQRAMKAAALERRDEWNAMPAALRDSIDRFNRLPVEVRERSLQTLIDQPEVTEALGQAVAQRQERMRRRDYGLGL